MILKSGPNEMHSLAYITERNGKTDQGVSGGKPENICAFFMIDTDNFKQINDTNGHMLGDIVLTEMAYGMKKNDARE